MGWHRSDIHIFVSHFHVLVWLLYVCTMYYVPCTMYIVPCTIYHVPAKPAPHHDQQHQQQVGRDPEHRQAHQDRRLGLGVVPAKIFVNT